MGKRRIIAETGAGQHGVASATACALLDLECVVYMGTEDMRRQRPNVERMRLLGARVVGVDAGARTLKEAVSEAIRDWVANVGDSHYIIGSCVGPAPFPALVRDLQRVIGDEARTQILAQAGRLPGAGDRLRRRRLQRDRDVRRLPGRRRGGVDRRRGGRAGIDTGQHGAPLTAGGRAGVLHGSFSAVMQDADGQILEAHSISAGLDYPGIGPEHAWLRDSGRARYVAVSDDEALAAFARRSRLEGIIPALESAHAIAWTLAARSRASSTSSACRAVVTRISPRCSSGSIAQTRRERHRADRGGICPLARRAGASGADALHDGRDIRISRPRARSASRTRGRALTSSSSGCRSPTRSRTDR